MPVPEIFPEAKGPTKMGEIVSLPVSHLDLLDDPNWTALTTVLPDNQPQTNPIWCNREGNYILFNTMRGFQKEKNLRVNPGVSLFVLDPRNPLRNIEVQGSVVEMTEEGAVEHNDFLTQLYTGKPGARFFGDAVPPEMAEKYHPVMVRVAPEQVRLDSEGRAHASGTLPVIRDSGNLKPAVPIPPSHQDLLLRPIYGVLATVSGEGKPHSSLVEMDFDGEEVLVTSPLDGQEWQNLQLNPRATLLVVDHLNTGRYLEVRGQVTGISGEEALEQPGTLAGRFTAGEGDFYPDEQPPSRARIILRLRPLKVTLDAFFNRSKP